MPADNNNPAPTDGVNPPMIKNVKPAIPQDMSISDGPPTAPPLAAAMAVPLPPSPLPPSPMMDNAGPGRLATQDTPFFVMPSPPPPPNMPPMRTPPVPAGANDLLSIKQQALQSLAPLVDKLDQPPEEKFKTLMMLIQASDNPDFVDDAYAAANNITDEKARAQALLDVVNEINYFTRPPDNQK